MAKINLNLLNEDQLRCIIETLDSSEEEDDDSVEFQDQDYVSITPDRLLASLQDTHESFICDVEDSVPKNKAIEKAQTYSQLVQKNRVWNNNVGCFPQVTFVNTLKVVKDYNNRNRPIDYFLNLFPNELLEMIVMYTNKYAQVKQSKFWRDTDIEEIKAFLGILILVGISPHSDLELYWSSDVFYNNIEISQTMSSKRFKKILENIHACDISTNLPRTHTNYDKLQKVRPMLEILNRTFQENAKNSSRQSVDESMIKFKGRDSKKQYMPMKPIKRGYKAWCRCDSETGYLYQFDIYQGKDKEAVEEGLGYRVVMKLCQQLPPNTLVAFDNFFTSVPLMEALCEKEIYALGTVRTNRKGIPIEFSDKNKEKKKEKLATNEFTYRVSNKIAFIKWRDTKDVTLLSTAVNPRGVQMVTRKQKDGSKKAIFCPSAIAEYTRNMGGVDRFDHYRSSYSIGRKSKKSWMRLFWFLFEAAVINSYILYKHEKESRQNTHREFRLRLARGLKANFKTPKKNVPVVYKNKKGGVFGVPDELRLGFIGEHWLVEKSYRRCRFCSTRKVERRTKYECKICSVPLCVVPCMEQFHK